MDIPEAVKRQVEDDEARLQAFREANTGLFEPARTDGEARQDGEDDQDGEGKTEEPEAAAVAAPAAEPAPAEPDQDGSAPEDVESLRAEVQRLKQAQRVLQGKYDAEVPRLHRVLRQKDEELAELRGKTAQSSGSSPTASDDGKRANPYGLTDEELSYGDDFISAARKIAERIVAEKLGPVKESVEATRERAFFEELNVLVPDWRSRNEDEGFLSWLDETHPETGVSRQEMLETAQRAGDARRVAAIFSAYKAPAAPVVPPGQSVAAPSVASQRRPSSAPGAVGAPSAPKRTYTLAEVEELTSQIARRTITGQKAVELQKDLDAAFAEGRIRA